MNVQEARRIASFLIAAADRAEEEGKIEVDFKGTLAQADDVARIELQAAIDAAATN